jgi:putative hydrolase of the HAD superfamily
MERDGIAQAIDIWAISDDVGIDKPDPGLFQYALREADVDPARAVMCGDRLDYDIEPAKGLGMRTVWVLRGEAPRHPTPQQLQVPDASVPSLDELPDAFEEERNRRGGAG